MSNILFARLPKEKPNCSALFFLGCPDTYENMITRMEEIEKTLAAIKETAGKASG